MLNQLNKKKPQNSVRSNEAFSVAYVSKRIWSGIRDSNSRPQPWQWCLTILH
jgi:urease gamma subunit